MNTSKNEAQIQVRFPLDVREELKRLATVHERSFNGEVIWALREYISQQKKEENNVYHRS